MKFNRIIFNILIFGICTAAIGFSIPYLFDLKASSSTNNDKTDNDGDNSEDNNEVLYNYSLKSLNVSDVNNNILTFSDLVVSGNSNPEINDNVYTFFDVNIISDVYVNLVQWGNSIFVSDSLNIDNAILSIELNESNNHNLWLTFSYLDYIFSASLNQNFTFNPNNYVVNLTQSVNLVADDLDSDYTFAIKDETISLDLGANGDNNVGFSLNGHFEDNTTSNFYYNNTGVGTGISATLVANIKTTKNSFDELIVYDVVASDDLNMSSVLVFETGATFASSLYTVSHSGVVEITYDGSNSYITCSDGFKAESETNSITEFNWENNVSPYNGWCVCISNSEDTNLPYYVDLYCRFSSDAVIRLKVANVINSVAGLEIVTIE